MADPKTPAAEDILGMSDADFANMPSPGASPEPEQAEETPAEEVEAEAEPKTETKPEAEPEADPEASEEIQEDAKEEVTPPSPGSTPKEAKPEPKVEGEAQKTKEAAEPAVPTLTPADHEAFYKKIVGTPLKANGKSIEIRTPEEAIGLMQMGANYTKKLQELAPYRKIMTMLDKNGLVDEDKLSFLIDIQNKNPDAIKKLVRDSGIDPMDIDTNAESNYKAGNHRVADDEVAFRDALDSLKTTSSGKATLTIIDTDWDDASKDMLWTDPEVMKVIHKQREEGVYDIITAELDRQKTLGNIPAGMPFLHAYKAVGEQMLAASQGNSPAQQQNSQGTGPAKPAVVATNRPAPTKPVLKNGDKATAASGTRSTTKPAKPFVNPLAMADDEFLKQFDNRL